MLNHHTVLLCRADANFTKRRPSKQLLQLDTTSNASDPHTISEETETLPKTALFLFLYHFFRHAPRTSTRARFQASEELLPSCASLRRRLSTRLSRRNARCSRAASSTTESRNAFGEVTGQRLAERKRTHENEIVMSPATGGQRMRAAG